MAWFSSRIYDIFGIFTIPDDFITVLRDYYLGRISLYEAERRTMQLLRRYYPEVIRRRRGRYFFYTLLSEFENLRLRMISFYLTYYVFSYTKKEGESVAGGRRIRYKKRCFEVHLLMPHATREPDDTLAREVATKLMLDYMEESNPVFFAESFVGDMEVSGGAVSTQETDKFYTTTMAGIYDGNFQKWRRFYILNWHLVLYGDRLITVFDEFEKIWPDTPEFDEMSRRFETLAGGYHPNICVE